jgi:predicted O-linked N-acetylglucosamine transferase (SPINDLY family)
MGQKHRNRAAAKPTTPPRAPAATAHAPVEGLLRRAMANHQAGQLAEADSFYKEALRLDPRHPVALLYRGALAQQVGQSEPALKLIDLALEAKPDYAEAWNNRGNVLKAMDDMDGAIACYARAYELAPGYAEALYNLALIFKRADRLEEAEAAYRQVIALKPGLADAHNNLGNILRQRGDIDAAMACYDRALELDPDYSEAHHNVGNALANRGDLTGALAAYERAVRTKPSHANAWEHLAHLALELGEPKRAAEAARTALSMMPEDAKLYGVLSKAYKILQRRDEALAAMARATELAPDDAAIFNDYGLVLEFAHRFEDALDAYRHAIACDPQMARAHLNLGNTRKYFRELDESLAHYREALRIDPDYHTAHTNILMTLHYMPAADKRTIFEEHKAWDARFGAPLAPAGSAYPNDPDPDRRLRIGFVSGSFMQHPAMALSIAGLETLDPAQVELIAYNNNAKSDRLTERVRAVMARWVSIIGLSDEVAAQRIREDRVDILVDLSGHASDNRLQTIARRPAPIQVKWVGGLFNTSGLSAMDYLISDSVETPPGEDEWYTEKIIRLPDGYIVYDPPDYAPAVGPLPALDAGSVTFGCFNNIIKVNPEIIALWARILKAVPDSRIILKSTSLREPRVKRGVLDDFANCGIAADRVELQGKSPHDELLATYNQIDIGLDPYPYSGGLTTCEAMWMGVPVVTRPGPTFAGRHSATHLSNAGLADWVVDSEDAYVEKAAWWASHLEELAALRARLRAQVAVSPLCDGPRFARNLEAAFRRMWRTWCAQKAAE